MPPSLSHSPSEQALQIPLFSSSPFPPSADLPCVDTFPSFSLYFLLPYCCRCIVTGLAVERRGIRSLFRWQAHCLRVDEGKPLGGGNLVYRYFPKTDFTLYPRSHQWLTVSVVLPTSWKFPAHSCHDYVPFQRMIFFVPTSAHLQIRPTFPRYERRSELWVVLHVLTYALEVRVEIAGTHAGP